MKNKNFYLLLNIIKKNGNVKRLIHENLDFKQIADLTNSALIENLISFDEETLVLTKSGEDLFNELDTKYKETNKDKWIKKEIKSKIIKFEKDFIYLPSQNDLDF